MNLLYHASTNKNLEMIEPQRTLSKDKYIGDYVFATSDRKLAAMYLVTRGTPTLMNTKAEVPRIIICADSTSYIKNDAGGAIYEVPGKSFVKTPQEGLEESELVGKVAVKPVSKKVFATSIDALNEAGVEVYFVNETQFEDIVLNKNEDEIISNLVPYRQ